MKGDTLEPLKIVGTRGMTVDTQEYHPEPRVAAIVASHFKPEFVVNVKETGKILMVNYKDIKNLTVTEIPAARFLHDGGWDATPPLRDDGGQPVEQDRRGRRQGRQARRAGRRRQDPAPGPRRQLRASEVRPGLGHRPPGQREDLAHRHRSRASTRQYAWKVCETLDGQGGGNLFIKTHPKSKHLYVDTPLNPDPKISRSIAVFDMKNLEGRASRCCRSPNGPASRATAPGASCSPSTTRRATRCGSRCGARRTSSRALVVVDDKTLKLKAVIKDPKLITPTGHFNVYNTQHDIY